MVQDRPVRVERRLAAILAADAVGYSRLMHHDEEATHAKLTTLLTGGIVPAIVEHGGRIVKNTGDGFLAEFPSAVEAVRAAVQFQTHIKELAAADAEDRRLSFRVGINVGDVIVEPHDIFGDCVNIAARLESIAEPGGICISSSAYDHVRGKVSIEFADLGEPQNATAHMALGIVQLCTRRAAQGVAECEHALVLNRNLAEAQALFGAAKLLLGRPAETEACVQEALRISPRDEGAHRWMYYVGLAKLHL